MKRKMRILLSLLAALLLTGCAQREIAPATPAEPPAPPVDYSGQLQISELMIKNKASVYIDGFPDWVELENISGGELALDGWRLADGPGKTGLPLSGSVSRDGFVLIPLGGESRFSLSEGETLLLLAPDGSTQESVLCSPATADASLQRQADGSFTESPWISPGLANGFEGYERFCQSQSVSGALVINEVMVSNRSVPIPGLGSYGDWVELKNVSDQALDLTGYRLTDDPDRPDRWLFPSMSLEPGELLVLLCDGDQPASQWNTGFSLNAVSEQLYLIDGSGALADHLALHDIPREGSMGRSDGRNGPVYFTVPTPGEENPEGLRRVSAMPEALTPDGVYDGTEALRVELRAAGDIYYTLDGSAPTTESERYEAPIVLESTSVLRAVALEEDAAPSPTASFSYFLNEGHSLPVLSLATDNPEYFRMVYNNNWKDPEVPANLSFYEEGSRVFSRDCDVSLKGWTSLAMPKKSLGVSFAGRYGGDLDCDVFHDGITEYGSLSLRVGQDYPYSIFRNELFQELCTEATDAVYTQSSQYCILYINGSYWGIYCLKDDVTRQFYATHAGVSKASVEAAKAAFTPDTSFFSDVLVYSWVTDLSVDENYQHFCELVDMDSLIDWFLLESYAANTDTQGNVRVYRSPENGNRWSFVLYDLDWGFYYPGASFSVLVNEAGNAGQQMPPTIRKLAQNPDFRERVFRRYAQLTQTVLSNEHVLEKIDEYVALLEPEVPRERARWGAGFEPWESSVRVLRNFVINNDMENFTVDQLCRNFMTTSEEELAFFGRTVNH